MLKRIPYILTLRGLLSVVFLGYLIVNPVLLEKDIVAATLSISALAVIFLFAAITVINGLYLKARTGFSVHPPSSSPSEPVESGKPVPFVITSEPFRMLPLFELNLELSFVHPTGGLLKHKITGFQKDRRVIREDIIFPHRGVWQVSGIEISCGDQLGLTSLRWELPGELLDTFVVVHPPYLRESSFPVLSSFSRTGDTVPDLNERRGDPFDLKQYHPSDGIKKIVWKIYAKSREVISRHPERAMTPEGQVAVFCLASRWDDLLCSHALAYLRKLEELDLKIYFGCQGMGILKPAEDSKAAETLLIETVWQDHSLKSVLTDLQDFLASLSESFAGRRPNKLLIFCSAQQPAGLEPLNLLRSIGSSLNRSDIQPIFLPISVGLQQPAGFPVSSSPPARAVKDSKIKLLLTRYFLEEQQVEEEPVYSFYPQFMDLCLKQNWEVIS